MAFTTRPRTLFPRRRSGVMSLLPAPGANRDPLAKSAPPVRALTKAGSSAGSVDPSAAIITMMSPVATANPHASALPLPVRVWVMTRMPGRRARATSMVASVEWPSTRITSCSSAGSLTKTCARCRSACWAAAAVSVCVSVIMVPSLSGAGGRPGLRTGAGRWQPDYPAASWSAPLTALISVSSAWVSAITAVGFCASTKIAGRTYPARGVRVG